MEEKVKQVLDGISEILPFSIDDIILVETNCGALWIDVKDTSTKLGKKTYNLYISECEPEEE